MRSSSLSSCLVAALVSQCSAHFLLNYPATVGFDDDNEGNAPCGGFDVDFAKANVTDFHVDGDTISVTSTHPQATWLFRATQDITAASNYTNLLPAVAQTGLGAFCETMLMVPSMWAGSKGIISIVQDATDGFLFQCAAVNFVAGKSTAAVAACKNATGLTASFTAAAALSTIPSSASPTASGMSGGMPAPTTSGSAPAATTSKAAAGSLSAPAAASWLMMAGASGLFAALL